MTDNRKWVLVGTLEIAFRSAEIRVCAADVPGGLGELWLQSESRRLPCYLHQA